MLWGHMVVFNTRGAILKSVILFGPMVVYDTTRSERHGVLYRMGSYALGFAGRI